MFGTQSYPEGQFKPQRGGEQNWHVWCATGALEVLRGQEYINWLAEHPDKDYTINFANASAAKIKPGHPLWEALQQVAVTHTVEVYPLNWTGEYVPWSGEDDSLRSFDAIAISQKESAASAEAEPCLAA